jgi:antitoxin component of RelBE/YafQ-DinJ toxin-antitoxin module
MEKLRMRQLNVRIDDRIYDQLNIVAHQHGLKRTELVRSVLYSVAKGNLELGVISQLPLPKDK